jgi:ankyrin repeat protein
MEQESLDGALMAAVRQGDATAVEDLLGRGADPNASADGPGVWESALGAAVRAGRQEILELLLDAGADVDRSRALYVAIQEDDVPAAQWLLEHGADPNGDPGDPPLGEAATSRVVLRMLRLLLSHGADPNGRFWADEETPLFFASGRYGSAAAVKVLLEAGADLHYRSRSGETALMWAAYQRDWGDLECPLSSLLEAGADPNVVNERARGVPTAALIAAAAEGNAANVYFLLRHGADPNLVDCDGRTALLAAAAAGHACIVRDLLRNGADPAVTDRQGRSPRELAEAYCRGLLELLPEGSHSNSGDS